MGKKIIVPIIICLVILLGIIGYIFWNNRTVSIITLDINPSIEISLDKNNKVKSVIALNESANLIITSDYEGLTLGAFFYVLIDKITDNDFVEGNDLSVILYSNGRMGSQEIGNLIEFEFGKKDVHTEIIIVDKITSEDGRLAKEYNVSPAKIAYIKTIIENNENIDLDNLANKSVSEIEETKKTGKYCDSGYTLEGDWCYKEIERKEASTGQICPSGYNEYKGKCYEEVHFIETDKLICRDDLKLVDNKCVKEDVYDATGICESGKLLDGNCIILEYYADAKEYCRITPSTDLLYNGRCLGRKPTINGKCIGGDKLINGYCYDTSSASGYKADWVCPDGAFITNPDGSLMYEDKKCYKEKKVKPSVYYCEGEGALEGKKCKIRIEEEPFKEIGCPDGYTLINNDRCYNFKKVKNKENGFVCDGEFIKQIEKTCIIYERVEAKSY